jgi:hypothetical protein
VERNEYLAKRREFEPESVTLVIVAESPPISGNYFYNPNGEVSEQLFKALMEQLGVKPKTKLEGLREFQNRGWVLLDATYEPVNAHGLDSGAKRNAVKRSGFERPFQARQVRLGMAS